MWNNISLYQDTDQKACRSLHFQGKSVCINIKTTELRNLQCLKDVGSFAVMSLFSDTTHVASLWNMPGMPFPVEIRNRKFSSNFLFDSVHILFLLFFSYEVLILELTGHLLITREDEEKGTVAQLHELHFHAWSSFEGSGTSQPRLWEMRPIDKATSEKPDVDSIGSEQCFPILTPPCFNATLFNC